LGRIEGLHGRSSNLAQYSPRGIEAPPYANQRDRVRRRSSVVRQGFHSCPRQLVHLTLADAGYSSPQLKLKPSPPITHTTAFRAVLPMYLHPNLDLDAFPYLLAGSGDCIRAYDISSLDEVEFIREVEGHWHDVTHLRTWIQESADGAKRDVWVVSGSLDGTLRKWKLSELVVPRTPITEEKKPTAAKNTSQPKEPLGGLTEEEEKELAELMGDDE